MTWGRIRGGGALAALAVLAALSVAPAAGANLRPGSTNAFMVGRHHELALPVPLPLNVPNLIKDRHGLGHVALCVRYQAANWSAEPGVARDRALVTVIVSRRMMTTGPDPSNPLYRHTFVDMAGLNRQHIVRCYRFQLPRSISNFLISKGAFVRSSNRRRSARHLLWIDIEQDRDFKKVDGRYDWREGTAVGAGDLAPPRPSLAAHAASTSSNPSGTLSITNATAAGVYNNCTNCVGQTSGLPPTISGTLNSPTYGIPLAVAGDAVACFDSGTNGSNPTGFANYAPNTTNPQPYLPGTVSAPSSGSSFPVTSGTTVTETLTGDDSLTPAPNTQTADTSGFISSTVKVGLQAIKSVFSYPSPGAVVTGVLGIIVYFLENSCKDYGNFFNVTSSETNGATTSTTINAPQTTGFGIADPTGSTPPGLQLNPSSLAVPAGSPSGSQLWLNNDIVVASPFADAGCNCQSYQGNSAIYMNWQNHNPCPSPYGAAECSLSPPQSPPVNYSGTNCGKSNASCPFPSASWPAPADAPRDLVYAALSGGSIGVLWGCDPFNYFNCYTGYQDTNTGTINALAYNGSNTIYLGDNDAYFFTCSAGTGDCSSTQIEGRSKITALAYTGSNVLAAVYDESGVNEGEMWSCNVSSGTCGSKATNSFPNGVSITSMVSFNGSVFAAGNNGVIYVCSPSSSSNSCSTGFTFSGKSIAVDSITSAYGELWAGLSNGQLWTCNPSATSCSPWDTLTGDPAITSLIAGPNHTVYVGAPSTNNPAGISQCSTAGANSCTGVTDTTTVTSLLYANNYLYYGTNDGAGLYQCNPNPTAEGPCAQLDNSAGTNGALDTSQSIPAMVAAPAPTG